MPQRRNYYRIQFPVGERPSWRVGGATYDVYELSEEGARIGPADAVPDWSGPIAGTLILHDGTETAASANLLRRENDYATLRFTENLPLPLIMSEQRRLLALFPRDTLR